MIEGLVETAHRRKVAIYLTGMSDGTAADLAAHGVVPPLVTIVPAIDDALSLIMAAGDFIAATLGD